MKGKISFLATLLALVIAVVALVAAVQPEPEARGTGAPLYYGSFIAHDADSSIQLWNGADLTMYSDGGSTSVFSLNNGADITLSGDSTGGNAGAKNEYIGLPRVKFVDLAQGVNGTTETVNYMDDSPAGEWSEVDGGTNIVVTADTSVYRMGANSLKIAFADVVSDEGVVGTAGAQDDLSSNESIGFWVYASAAVSSGDFNLVVDDSNGTDQTYDIGSIAANVWSWKEINISGCNANCDTMDNIKVLATAQGAGALTALDLYIDYMWKWDADNEEALGIALVQDGVLNVLSIPTASGTNNTWGAPAEGTDFFVHYESGNDFVVWVTDQSSNEVLALVAY